MNLEQRVIDSIDQLISEQLEAGPQDDYSKPYVERCELCQCEWHGLPSGSGCPGAYASRDERDRWSLLNGFSSASGSVLVFVDQVTSVFEGSIAVAGFEAQQQVLSLASLFSIVTDTP